MTQFWQLFLIGTAAVAISGAPSASGLDATAIPQSGKPVAQIADSPKPAACPQRAVLSRLIQHSIQPGETLNSLARRYNLLPTTLMAINPSLRKGKAPVGTKIVIPPYNGIVVALPPGQTLKDLAAVYPVRPDVLFEVNGCQSAPSLAFVPGVNWSPVASRRMQAAAPVRGTQPYRYPLPAPAPLLLGYGWHVNPQSQRVEFHGGVDLQAAAGTPVKAAAAGTVAFAGSQGDYGNLVVINHSGGYQTRYAQLDAIAVRSGQRVQPETRLGTVGTTGKAQSPHLHFEVRLNSSIGWVAQDPARYLSEIERF